MAIKTKKISTLIESQLPNFIVDEYPLFSKFLEKYYEAQESSGQPLDVATNILEYTDINFYEQNLLKEYSSLSATISNSDTTITLEDASSFPESNGYVRIDNEIVFYASRDGNVLSQCSRGVSGNTTLGDLYGESTFVTTEAAQHPSGATVYNVSNLFLYALSKSFDAQYLATFPEKYLKSDVDKRTLVKNIRQFYKTKGTDASIRFIFNAIVSKDTRDVPETYNPKDFTYKSSNADWINVFALKVKIVSGNVKDLIGKKIVQLPSNEYGYASATVDNVRLEGEADGETIWNIVLAPETVNGEFAISTKTRLEAPIGQNDGIGTRLNVFSTIGWGKTGSVLIGEETFEFEDKNVTQFTISKRGDTQYSHAAGADVYKPVIISGSNVNALTLGVVYNFDINSTAPYSYPGDKVQISVPGFESDDPKIVQTGTRDPRWIFNRNLPVQIPTLNQVSSDVSAIFSDDQYYYITSSGYPSHSVLDTNFPTETLLDQKLLRIIRKKSSRTTENYKTPKSEVGIGLNGVRFYSYRDASSVRYGQLESIEATKQGTGYAAAPFVLLDQVPNKARAVLSGSVVERYIVDTDDVFPRTPVVEVTSGRGAVVTAVITNQEVSSLVIENPGEYYSSPPIVRITDRNGKGRFADYEAIVNTEGKITGFVKNAGGSFYNQNTVRVDIIPVGTGAVATPFLTEWNFNRYEKYKSKLDSDNGYVFPNYNFELESGYGYTANPKALRVALNDNITASGLEPLEKVHSPIIGFAYDGNPIYGPFAHKDPLDSSSPIIRMTSSYRKRNSRSKGPSTSKYPIGTFTNDFEYIHKSGTLDENNGRFCVTADFPKGTYAYFLTIDSDQVPQYPYILGDRFYSLPVDSNYNSNINQNDVPKNAKRFFVAGMPRNGEGLVASVSEVKSGTIDSIDIQGSSRNFTVDSKVYFDNTGSEGSEAEALVESVKGRDVSYLDSYENKVVKLTTIQNAYLFTDDTLRQPSSSASGVIVGTVQNDNEIVLKNVIGTFDNTGTFSADIKTFFILLDQRSSYTKGATLSLTDGINPPVATGEILNGTSSQNTVEIKVLSGDWFEFNNPDVEYFLQSSDTFNTSGTKAVTLTSLSDGLEPFEVNQSVALIETEDEHGLGIGDKIDVSIFPDDNTKVKTYFLKKRLYQDVVLKAPVASTVISDTGIGRFQILNGGADYTTGTYNNVPLTGGSGSGATANISVAQIQVSDNQTANVVTSVEIQSKGSGYQKSDYLSVDDESLGRSVASLSTARLIIYVDHVGFSAGGGALQVASSVGFADGDLITVGSEIMQISSLNGNILNVISGRENTEAIDHYDGQEVSLYKAQYNFAEGFQVSSSAGSAYVASYDLETQRLVMVYDYEIEKDTANAIQNSTTFFDSSSPKRLARVASADQIEYKFEFSEDNVTYVPNPIIEIQEFYRYIFDTSDPSLTGTYFDLSPSRNYNIITTEKLVSTNAQGDLISPGNPGSFTEVKFGFGSRLADNQYNNKVGTDFTNYYYFDKNNIVDSDGQYFKIVNDPLQGAKTVNYVTSNRFVFDVPPAPLWDGSGTILYTTTGKFAVGEINSFKINNLGLNYKKVPVILGIDPAQKFKESATVLFDEKLKVITGVQKDSLGTNYSNPKAVIVDGDGEGAKFDVVVRPDGTIFSITVADRGKGYTYAPKIEIIEEDVEAYVDSDTIGIPQSISILKNGGAFHLDKTVSSSFTSNYTVSLKKGTNADIGTFAKGETVIQKSANGAEVMRAKVAEFREGTNVLRLENVTGIIREDLEIVGVVTRQPAVVKSVFVSTFGENITSFFDNSGYYASDRGKLGVSNQRIVDSYFYQDYSYVIKSKTPIDQWRELIKSTTHPAGFRLFGQVDIEVTAPVEMPEELPKADHFSIIQLWDPNKNKITVENTTRVVTQIVQKVENQRIHRGAGSIATSDFNFNESRAFTVSLNQPFDGVLSEDYLGNSPIAESYRQYQEEFKQWNPNFLVDSTFGGYQTIDVVGSNDHFVFYKVTPISNSFEDLGLDLNNPSGVPRTVDFSAWEFAANTGSIPEIVPDNRAEIQGTVFNLGSATGQFEITRSNRGYINPDYANLSAEPFLIDSEEFGRVFLIWFQSESRYIEFFKDFAVDDRIKWYPVPSNRDAWIELRVDEVVIDPAFVSGTQGVLGTKTFQLLDDRGLPFTPFSAKNLIITLDGILQEPEVAYTVSGDTITFAQPPLGAYQKLTGSQKEDLTSYSGTTFYGKYFSFKDNQYNTKHIKKLRNIFQRNGRWLDAANQIERNRTFIVEETIGYALENYPSLDWSTKLDDYTRDIGFILDGYEHDLRFGGNVKTVDFVSYFNNDSQYDYITKAKTESLDIFRYAKNLATLAIRNWDIVEENVNYIQGSRTMTVADTERLAVGMHVSSGRSYPTGTKIVSIDSSTQITLSSAALANSGGAGGAPAGETTFSGSTDGDTTSPTNTAVVEPGDTFAVEPGDTFSVPTSFAGTETATFFFSGINSGQFYDAADIIARNKQFIIEVVIASVYATYPDNREITETKCRRDLGFFIDAIAYHLRFGGNQRVVENARLYYTNLGYPSGERLSNLGTQYDINATLFAWTSLNSVLVTAMRQDYDGQTFAGVEFITDPGVAADSQFPYCAEVEAAIGSMTDIMRDIVENGTGVVDPTPINSNKPGNWTSKKPYTDYDLIPDPLLVSQECDDVISSVNSLYDNVVDVLDSVLVPKTLPDYVDGETTVFEMYWDDDTEVSTEEDEDLFLTINAVLQRPKYTEEYPGADSYYIDRTTIPNKLVFDTPPIWDQDFGAKSIGEPTAVEKVVGIGVSNYKRLTIDYNLVNGTRSGPFIILDVEDNTVQKIEAPEYLYVFLDGVLQREGYSYTISGPNIYFTVPIKSEMKIDMRYIYGRDVGQTLNLYDFSPNTYYSTGTIVFEQTSNPLWDVLWSDFADLYWMGDYRGNDMHLWQLRSDGTKNVIGLVKDYYKSGLEHKFTVLIGHNSVIEDDLDYQFAAAEDYSKTFTIRYDSIQNVTLTYDTDEYGRKLLSDRPKSWARTAVAKRYKNPFVYLREGDKIRVDGESDFRTIKQLPERVTSKEGRVDQPVSGDYYTTVGVEAYNGITRGEGLSVVAIMETTLDDDGNEVLTGKIERLEWNRRSYDPTTQPTAYQYYTPPVLEFVPANGQGGGARANVLVSKGQVLSVDLVSQGSGYTEAPRVVVARKYDVIRENRDIGVSVINVGLRPYLENVGIVVTASIDTISLPEPLAFTSTAVIVDSPVRLDLDLTSIIQTVPGIVSEDLSGGIVQPLTKITTPKLPQVKKIDLFPTTNQFLSLVSGRLADVISTNSIVSTSKQITTSLENLIPNDALSNVNFYDVGAYLDVDLDPTDTVIYVPNTAKFKNYGYLLVGNETVFYYRKLNDRFLKVLRGQENSTAQFWPAGTFMRQIPDPVYVATSGVVSVFSEASVAQAEAIATTSIGGREDVTTTQIEVANQFEQTVQYDLVIGIEPELFVDSISSVTHEQEVRVTQAGAGNITSAFETFSHQETLVTSTLEVESVKHQISVRETVVEVTVDPTVIAIAETTVISQRVSIVPKETFTSFNSLTHEETLVQQELWKFLEANVWQIAEQIVEVSVTPSIVSIYETTVISQSVSIVPKETFASFNSLTHEETLVQGELWKFLEANVWQIADQVIEVSVTPSIISIFETTGFSQRIAIRPSETFESINTLSHKETTVQGELWKFLDANVWEITEQIIEVSVAPSISSSTVTFTTVESYALLPLESEGSFNSLTHEETYVRTYSDASQTAAITTIFNFEITDTFINVGVTPTVSTSTTTFAEVEAIAVRPHESFTVYTSIAEISLEDVNTVQTVSSEFTIQKNQLEVLLFTPPSGVVDGYQESAFISDPIATRESGFIDLDNDYDVLQRDGDVVDVVNSVFGKASDYAGNYTSTNAGHRISHFEGMWDDGTASVSGLSIGEFDNLFPTFTLADFEERGNSSYTIAGDRFTLMPPSIQNPVAIMTSVTNVFGGSILVSTSTAYFPDEGYLFMNGTVYEYTSKTASSFDGITIYNGDGTFTTGHDVIPFTVE